MEVIPPNKIPHHIRYNSAKPLAPSRVGGISKNQKSRCYVRHRTDHGYTAVTVAVETFNPQSVGWSIG